MAIKEFNLAALADLDGGRIAEAVNQEIKRVITDCQDRPQVEKARSITLQFDFEPLMDDQRELDGCQLSFQIKSTLPKRESKSFNLGVKKDGRLFFSEHSPDNVNQRTIMDEE